MLVRKNRLLAIIMVVTMLVALLPAMAFGDEHDPVPNYAFIPNSGEASVSKVDLVNMEEVARYYTAPRYHDVINFDGTTDGAIANTVYPIRWRTSRIAMDKDGNAWVLNTGADGYRTSTEASGIYPGSSVNLVGSVVRIQADTSGLTTTAIDEIPITFGTDQAVQVFPVGTADDMPRAIAIDDKGFIWVGFYGSGALVKYSYDEITGELNHDEEEDVFYPPQGTTLRYYEMKFAPDGTLFISSRKSTPSRNGNYGVWSFKDGVFNSEWEFSSPYALLISDKGQVYATSYNSDLWIRGTGTIDITGVSDQNLRGMAFDETGKIWIASTTGGSGGNRIYWYDPTPDASPASGFITLQDGNTPVGVGRAEAGLMWAICRTDNLAEGFIEAFNPVTGLYVDSIEVGFRPYAYGDFIVPPPPTYCICGYKLDADTGEALPGWTINLYKWNEDLGEWDWIDDTLTALDDGKYCFDELLEGEYMVSEVLEDGWKQIIPANNKHEVSLPDDASDCEATLETVEAELYNFVNAKLYEIAGVKYRTGTDMGLGGWLIKLEKWDDSGWVPVAMTATDINGDYSFTGLLAGDYRVSETLKPGWTQTYPGVEDNYVHMLTLPAEEEMGYDFYNMPEMKCYDDTIWAYGGEDGKYTDVAAAQVMENRYVDGNPSKNWGWTNLIEEEGTYIFTLYRGAGQNDLENGTAVGTLTVDFDGTEAIVTYAVAKPYTLSEVHLWVGETMLPETSTTRKGVTTYKPTSAPGQLAKLGFSPEISADGLSATITVPITAPFWVAAHGVVDWCELVALPETSYYHWGVGYPYGATPETYATASVSPEGIMDVWWYSDGLLISAGWYHDVYTITDTAGFFSFPVANLNDPVRLLHGIHYPGVDTTYYKRVAVDVVPVPNAMSIFIP